MTLARTLLLTGLPDGLALRFARRCLANEADTRLFALVRADHLPEMRAALIDDDPTAAGRVRLLVGDVTLPSLQLEPAEWSLLQQEVTEVFHFASCYHIGVDKLRVEQVNIDGTRNVLAFARTLRTLVRFHHVSSAFVCGDRRGVILEDELEAGQHFRNTWERTRFVAELEVRRAMVELPVSVYRPTLIVGDSTSGRLDRYEGPHYLLPYAVRHPARLISMLPRSLRSPVHVVPIDYVVQALDVLGRDPRALGRTLHIADAHPISLPHALRLVSEYSRQPALHEALRARLAGVARRIPGFRGWGGAGLPTIDELDAPLLFNAMRADAMLWSQGVRCPPLPDYVDTLVEAVYRAETPGRLRSAA